MQYSLFKDTDVIDIINDYIVEFVDLTEQSFDAYLKVASILGNVPIRTRCDIIRAKAIELFQERFSDDENIKLIHYADDVFAIIVHDKIVLRYKKLDGRKKANFNKTSKSKNFINQLTLSGIFSNRANLILGYRPDQIWSRITNIYIAHPQGLYAHNISDVAESHRIENAVITSEAITQTTDQVLKPSVKIKTKKVIKNGTESNKP